MDEKEKSTSQQKTPEEIEAEREARRQFAEAKQKQKEVIAQQRGSVVIKPLFSAEATCFYNMGLMVEDLFEMPVAMRMRKKPQDLRDANIMYRKAVVEFSDALKKISKKIDTKFNESFYVRLFKKDIDDAEKMNEYFEHAEEFAKWKALQSQNDEASK